MYLLEVPMEGTLDLSLLTLIHSIVKSQKALNSMKSSIL